MATVATLDPLDRVMLRGIQQPDGTIIPLTPAPAWRLVYAYKVVRWDELPVLLRDLGAEGWELVTDIPREVANCSLWRRLARVESVPVT